MSRPAVIPLKLRLVQSLDRTAGPLLTRLHPARAALAGPVPAADIRRVLVIRPGGLGDALLCWPMLNALRRAWPAAAVEVLAEGRNAAAFTLAAPMASSARPLTVRRYDQSPWQTVSALRRARFDVVIDTEQYHHLSTLLASHLKPRWLAGFATLGRARLLTHAVPHTEDRYEALSFLQLAEALTGQPGNFDPDAPFLAAPAEARAWAQRELMAAGAATGQLVALLPAAGGAHRLWAPARFAEVGRELADRGYRLLLLGGNDAREAAGRIAGQIAAACPGAPLLDLAGRTTLAQTAALIERARLSLSSDTGVLHLAYGLGTPTIGLFGPGLHAKWAPPGQQHRAVRLGLPCSPCMRHGRFPPCPIDIACLRDLGTAPVLAAAGELLR